MARSLKEGREYRLYESLPDGEFLQAAWRLDAADFEPMESGINRKAYEAIPGTNWDKYPYSVILVLGCGPERQGEAISPQSRMRALYAVQLYKKGLAPFLVVSGGRVHPFKTSYSEAFEMKKYMMENCGIPEEAIIADPPRPSHRGCGYSPDGKSRRGYPRYHPRPNPDKRTGRFDRLPPP